MWLRRGIQTNLCWRLFLTKIVIFYSVYRQTIYTFIYTNCIIILKISSLQRRRDERRRNPATSQICMQNFTIYFLSLSLLIIFLLSASQVVIYSFNDNDNKYYNWCKDTPYPREKKHWVSSNGPKLSSLKSKFESAVDIESILKVKK